MFVQIAAAVFLPDRFDQRTIGKAATILENILQAKPKGIVRSIWRLTKNSSKLSNQFRRNGDNLAKQKQN
jgi:hypothetical protein